MKKIVKKYRYLKYLLYVLPAFTILCVFGLYPNLQIYYYAFLDWNGFSRIKTFVGFRNFTDLQYSPYFKPAIMNTFLYMANMVVTGTIIALLLAVVLKRNTRFNKIMRTLIFTPMVLSSIMVAIIWTYMFDVNIGAINSIIRLIGFENFNLDFLGKPFLGILSISTVHLWHGMGVAVIILLSGLQTIPKSLYEAAAVEGASKMQEFLHITLPLMSPTILRVVLLKIISGALAFDYVYALGSSVIAAKSDTLSVMMFRKAISDVPNVGSPSAIGVILSVGIFLFFVLQYISTRKVEESIS